jgi:hypothetical protein
MAALRANERFLGTTVTRSMSRTERLIDWTTCAIPLFACAVFWSMTLIDLSGKRDVLMDSIPEVFEQSSIFVISIILSGPVSVLCGGFLLLVVRGERITWTRRVMLGTTITPTITPLIMLLFWT